jgi:hypothetical protein
MEATEASACSVPLPCHLGMDIAAVLAVPWDNAYFKCLANCTLLRLKFLAETDVLLTRIACAVPLTHRSMHPDMFKHVRGIAKAYLATVAKCRPVFVI